MKDSPAVLADSTIHCVTDLPRSLGRMTPTILMRIDFLAGERPHKRLFHRLEQPWLCDIPVSLRHGDFRPWPAGQLLLKALRHCLCKAFSAALIKIFFDVSRFLELRRYLSP